MKSLILGLACAVAVALVASPAVAQKAKKQNRQQERAAAQAFKLPDSITLTAEQQEKVEALKKEYAPKLAELNKKAGTVMTPERRKAQKEATDAAKAAGTKGPALREAGLAALNLSAEERAKLDEVQNERAALQKEINGKIREILTPEQREQLPKRQGKKKANK